MDGLSSTQLLGVQEQLQNADVYTDLNSLQKLKTEENKDEALKKVAQQFESMFLDMMLKSMRDANAVFEKDSMFNSNDVKFYRDMYDKQLTLSMAHSRSGGVGIADAMYRQLSQTKGEKIDPSKLGILSSVDRTTKTKPEKSEPFAQSPDEFIRKVTPAIEKAAKALGVDTNLLVAQSALETGWGKFILQDEAGNSSYNLFNIKANSEWSGKHVDVSSLEFSAGSFKPERSEFRAYDSIEQSVDDYIEFVKSNPRYQKALDSGENAEQYIRELHNAGYATDPQYAEKVLAVRERLVKGA